MFYWAKYFRDSFIAQPRRRIKPPPEAVSEALPNRPGEIGSPPKARSSPEARKGVSPGGLTYFPVRPDPFVNREAELDRPSCVACSDQAARCGFD
jgi:hypothetical protein